MLFIFNLYILNDHVLSNKVIDTLLYSLLSINKIMQASYFMKNYSVLVA